MVDCDVKGGAVALVPPQVLAIGGRLTLLQLDVVLKIFDHLQKLVDLLLPRPEAFFDQFRQQLMITNYVLMTRQSNNYLMIILCPWCNVFSSFCHFLRYIILSAFFNDIHYTNQKSNKFRAVFVILKLKGEVHQFTSRVNRLDDRNLIY